MSAFGIYWVVLLSILAPTSAGQTGQKPVVSKPVPMEGRGALATLEELWAKSDVVVEGIIQKEEPGEVTTRDGSILYTFYDVRLVAVYKTSPRVSAGATTIRMRRRGGVRDRGNHIEAQLSENYPLFKLGERYLLFVRQSREDGPQGLYYYETTYGPDSAFEVQGSSISSKGKSSLARSMSGDIEALRNQLRRLRGGQ
jgi:hypothetical protein